MERAVQFPQVDTDIPFAEYPPTFEDYKARVEAMFRTIADIADEVQVDDTDIVTARGVFAGTITPTANVLSSPGTVVHIKALLDEYDKAVVQSAAQIRTYVTNRLIEDSNHADPRIRLRCYEMLGKISDVGLFTEKSEVTLKHRPTEELEQLLRERLMKTINAEDPTVLPNPTVLQDPE